MDRKTQEYRKLGPDYARIYSDLIQLKFPELQNEMQEYLQIKKIGYFDIQQINKKLFGEKKHEQLSIEQKYKAYDVATILEMLRYQKEYGYTNTQLANHFRLSRNTVANWKKTFKDNL